MLTNNMAKLLMLSVIIGLLTATRNGVFYLLFNEKTIESFNNAFASSYLLAILGFIEYFIPVFLMSIVLLIVSYVINLYVLSFIKNERFPTFTDIKPYFWKVLILKIIVFVILIFSSLLLIIPGIIANILLMFSIYVLIFQDLEYIDCLKKSKDIVVANIGIVLGYGFVFFLVVSILYAFIGGLFNLFIILLSFLSTMLGHVFNGLFSSLYTMSIVIFLGVFYKKLVPVKRSSRLR